jgi:flagellar motility protein MotE (MotC chaperone)
VNGKLILTSAAAGVISFAGAFAAGWFTSSAPVAAAAASNQAGAVTQPQTPGGLQPQTLTPTAAPLDDAASTRAMTEQQLKAMIDEVREKIQEYDAKLKSLEKERERLQIAQQVLKKDIESLNNLRVDLATTAAGVKTERDLLLKTRVEIERTERANLTAIAAAYDKMDAASAGDILANMATGQSKSGGSGSGSGRTPNIDDAVKILHFMQDRTKAKVLAEMVAKEPALAALLCQKLKQVQEGR